MRVFYTIQQIAYIYLLFVRKINPIEIKCFINKIFWKEKRKICVGGMVKTKLNGEKF